MQPCVYGILLFFCGLIGCFLFSNQDPKSWLQKDIRGVVTNETKPKEKNLREEKEVEWRNWEACMQQQPGVSLSLNSTIRIKRKLPENKSFEILKFSSFDFLLKKNEGSEGGRGSKLIISVLFLFYTLSTITTKMMACVTLIFPAALEKLYMRLNLSKSLKRNFTLSRSS